MFRVDKANFRVQSFRRKILRELKKIKLAWPELNYATAPGVLILLPSKPSIPPQSNFSLWNRGYDSRHDLFGGSEEEEVFAAKNSCIVAGGGPAGRSRSQRKDRLRRSPLGKGSNDNSRRRFSPKIWVELHSSERLKGKLIEATGTGLRLVRLRYETKIAKSGSGRRQSARRFERQDTETLIERKEIRTIRPDPARRPATSIGCLACWQASPPDLGWSI